MSTKNSDSRTRVAHPTDSQAASLHEDLARVLALLEKADAGLWLLYDEKLRPEYPVRVMEIQQANGRAVIPWTGFDSPDKTRTQRRNNANAIIAAINFLRKHGPELSTTPQDAAGVEPTGWLHEIQWTDGWGSPKYRHGPTKPPAHLDVVQYPELVRPTVVSERFTPVYATTPPPGVDVGKLRELVDRWRDEANAGYLTGKPEIDSITEARQHVYFECADQLDATMSTAGVGNA